MQEMIASNYLSYPKRHCFVYAIIIHQKMHFVKCFSEFRQICRNPGQFYEKNKA